MKRILALLLLMATLMTVVLGCNDENKTPNNGSGIGTEDSGHADGEPNVPVFDGEGREFIFLIRAGAEAYNDVFVFGEKGDEDSVLGQAIYKRNQLAETKFNLVMTEFPSATPASKADELIMLQEDAYDVLDDQFLAMRVLLTESGKIYDINDVPYIDLEKTYWAGTHIDELSFGGKVYVTTSTISMRDVNAAQLLYFSKAIIEECKLTSPYDLMESNEWVLENYYSMIAAAAKDLNGNGVPDKEDRFGHLSVNSAEGGLIPVLYGAGFKMTEKDEDDYPVAKLSDERLITFMQRYNEVYNNKQTMIGYDSVCSGEDTSEYAHIYKYVRRTKYINNQFLFFIDGIGCTDDLTEMEAPGYGIVPLPKYDSTQEEYHAFIDPHSTKFAIPSTNSRLEETGAFLEWLAWKSEQIVLPAYYDSVLKYRRLEDEEARRSLDIVRKAATHEITELFDVNIISAYWTAFRKNEYASTFAMYEPVINKNIQIIISNLIEVDE